MATIRVKTGPNKGKLYDLQESPLTIGREENQVIQILDHHQYAEEAAATHAGIATVPAARGAILDSTGFPLATSEDTWDVYIDRFQWRDHVKKLSQERRNS